MGIARISRAPGYVGIARMIEQRRLYAAAYEQIETNIAVLGPWTEFPGGITAVLEYSRMLICPNGTHP